MAGSRAEPRRIENRKSARLAVNHPAELEFLAAGRPSRTTAVLDSLAKEGLRLTLSAELALSKGAVVGVIFRVAGERFYVRGVVQWVSSLRVGLRLDFDRIRDQTRRRWAAWIDSIIGASRPG